MKTNFDYTAIINTVITVTGGILSVYIVGRFRKLTPRSKEHVDKSITGYENIIKRQDGDNEQLRLDVTALRTALKERDAIIASQTTELNYLRALMTNRAAGKQ